MLLVQFQFKSSLGPILIQLLSISSKRLVQLYSGINPVFVQFLLTLGSVLFQL